MRKIHPLGILLALLLTACQKAPLYDVVVVGGGPAGIGAALAAAETGARTALVERDSRIGGTTVQAEVVDMGLFYAWRRQIVAGPVWRLVTRAVDEAGCTLPDFSKQLPDHWMESCVHVDPAVYSRVAEDELRKAGITLFLNREVSSIEKTRKGWRLGAEGSGPDAGREIRARQVIDATGNATVAALAGAERVQEPEETRQPGSYFFRIDAHGAEFDTEAVNNAYREAVERGEMLPTDVYVGMAWFIRKGGGSGCYIPLADNSTPEARAETNRRGIETRDRVLAFIRRQPGLEDVELVSSASEVGVRETYRVVGEKTVTESDYLAGVIPEDALSWSYWMVDEHKAGTGGARLVFHEPEKVGTVPLGAMLPKGVGNLLVAGRAVSSDHAANSALRVQASCMGMGQAAGVVAALAAARHCDPREVSLEEVKKQLKSIGHLVPESN